MIDFQATVDTEVVRQLTAALKDGPKKVQRYVRRELRTEAERRIIKKLRTYPRKPHYPLRWASERQRKYVMAMLRRQDNLPYQRTGGLRRGWDVEVKINPTTAFLVIVNDSPAAQYVMGDRQQPFHKDTGWPFAGDIIYKESARLADDMVAAWYDAILETR